MRLKHWVLLLMLSLGSLAPLRAEFFEITNYKVVVVVDKEGYADFEEIIEVRFLEPRHGIFRFIPVKSEISGKSVKRSIRKVEVEGFKFKTYTEGSNFVIRIGDKDVYVDGVQTYRIHYRVDNPVNFFENSTEFYWDLLGTQWEVPILHFEYAVQFPESVRLGPDDYRIYTGARGSTISEATLIQSRINQLQGETVRAFNPGEGVTLAVRLPQGSIKQPSLWEMMLLNYGILLAPFAFLIVALRQWFRVRNRRETIMVELFPPEGISPAVVGGFVDHSVDSSDALCLLPLLASKGYLRMEAEEGGFWSKDRITFFKLKNADSELQLFEADFLNKLFASGDEVALDDLKNKFYKDIADIRSKVRDWIDEQGWYEAVNKKYALWTALGGGALLVIGIVLLVVENYAGFGFIGTAILMFFIATRFNQRTPLGNEQYRRMEGFRRFVQTAEKPMIERLLKDDPLYYDKTLPYAVAFGEVKRWNRQFEGLLSEPPQWYGGYGLNRTATMSDWNSFSTQFPQEIDRIGSVFTSTPGSSGSSSGGGGGFSGGGSGGGGGGSW